MKWEYLEHQDALCNDGSRAGFYYSAAPPGHEKVWVIYQQGGGQCWDKPSCDRRSETLTSSKGYAKETSFSQGSILEAAGTDYEKGHKIFVKYCTSDAYIGNSAGRVDGKYFRGRVVVRELFKTLQARGMGEGSTVLLGGCSAGGRGVMHNLNHVGRQIAHGGPGSVKRLVGLIDSGFYLGDHEDLQDLPLTWQLQKLIGYTSADVDPTCSSQFPDERWKCLIGEYAVPTLTIPHIVSAGLSDTYQLSPSRHPESVQVAFNRRTRQGLLDVAQTGNAVHGPACAYHCIVGKNDFSFAKTVQGVSLATIADNFVFKKGGTTSAVDTCSSYACGDGCAAA